MFSTTSNMSRSRPDRISSVLDWWISMPISMSFRSAIVLFAGLIAAGSLRANWPQWRGPNSDGSSKTARGLATNWTQTENVLWRTKLPSWSAATPIVWADTIFVTSAEAGFQSTETVKGVLDDPVRGGPPSPQEKILLFAVNRQDGAIRWQQVVGMGNKVV